MARPSHGCDDYVKIAVLSPEGDIKIIVSTIIPTDVLNTLTLK